MEATFTLQLFKKIRSIKSHKRSFLDLGYFRDCLATCSHWPQGHKAALLSAQCLTSTECVSLLHPMKLLTRAYCSGLLDDDECRTLSPLQPPNARCLSDRLGQPPAASTVPVIRSNSSRVVLATAQHGNEIAPCYDLTVDTSRRLHSCTVRCSHSRGKRRVHNCSLCGGGKWICTN